MIIKSPCFNGGIKQKQISVWVCQEITTKEENVLFSNTLNTFIQGCMTSNPNTTALYVFFDKS